MVYSPFNKTYVQNFKCVLVVTAQLNFLHNFISLLPRNIFYLFKILNVFRKTYLELGPPVLLSTLGHKNVPRAPVTRDLLNSARFDVASLQVLLKCPSPG